MLLVWLCVQKYQHIAMAGEHRRKSLAMVGLSDISSEQRWVDFEKERKKLMELKAKGPVPSYATSNSASHTLMQVPLISNSTSHVLRSVPLTSNTMSHIGTRRTWIICRRLK